MHANHPTPKNTYSDYINHPRLSQLVYNQQSMTAFLDNLNHQLSVEELDSDINNHQYSRCAVLKLDGKAIIVAISVTNLEHKTFYNILSQAKNRPIGEKLFANSSGIMRDNHMEIKTSALKNVASSLVVQYLLSLGYKEHDRLMSRSSKFYTTDKQTMYLTEWLLPPIVDFLPL